MPASRTRSLSSGADAPPGSTSKGDPVDGEDEHFGSHSGGKLSTSAFLLLAWSSIGVIFGDIATSPLYVYDSIFDELIPNGYPTKDDVMGAACLIFWTLTLVVMVKYIGVVLKADDQGQGGTFALYSLLCRNMGIKPHGARGPAKGRHARTRSRQSAATGGGAAHPTVVVAGDRAAAAAAASPAAAAAGSSAVDSPDQEGGNSSDSDSDEEEEGSGSGPRPWWQRGAVRREVFQSFFRRNRRAQIGLWGVAVIATAMLMGDGVLTPAMSVLSAVSGLNEVAPSLGQNVIIGVTILVLFVVFALQPIGTGKVGAVFAPVIALWLFANLAINCYTLSLYGGAIFGAINPAHIVTFFSRHGATAWRSLGAVMLCVTGAEALFADLGHFSRGSISVAFGVLAYPCLVITYFGQASHVIAHPTETDAFWKSLPQPLLYPMLILATLATIVASQALISGIFSIIRQAMILGAFPPARIIHTGGQNPAQATQVYIPVVNAVLFALCCIVVGGFQSTVALGKAYGLAVMTDMMTTTCLVTLVMLSVWEVSLFLVVPFFGLFLVLEGAYWSANIIKVPQGGWFTLAVAAVVSLIMLIWWAGSRRLGERLAAITAGVHIRVLGRPPPPPLLKEPPTPPTPAPGDAPPPATPLVPISTAAAAAASGPAGPRTASRMLYRLPSWVVSGGRRSGPGAARDGRSEPPELPSSPQVMRASSLPHSKVASGASLSLRVRGGLSVSKHAAPGVEMARALLEADQGPGGSSGAGGAEAAAPPTPVSAAEALARDAGLVYGDGGAGGGVGGAGATLMVSETIFPAGTLALVLPADGPALYGLGAPAGGGMNTSTTVLLDAADGDVETGIGAAAALLAPAVMPLVARLPGIGVYYMDEKVGGVDSGLPTLPPVLVHFLRNVQAIHEVCVFLSVRSLPTPTIDRRHRLQVYTPPCAAAPNFYQVVARYGYLDVIDHGPAFMSEVLDGIQKRLVAVQRRAIRGVLPRGLRLAATHPGREDAATLEHTGTGGLPPWDENTDRPLARQGQHNPIIMTRLANSLRNSASSSPRYGSSMAVGSMVAAAAAAGGRGEDADSAVLRSQGSDAAAAAHRDAVAAARAQVEEAVAAFQEARLHGIVYYASRASIRQHQEAGRGAVSQYVQWCLYGLLYRWLAAIAYVDMERWRVPPEHLVELGMPVAI